MPDYNFPLTLIFPYEDRVAQCVLIREITDQRKPVFWHMLHGVKGGKKFYLTNISTVSTHKTYCNEPLTLYIAYFTPNNSCSILRKIQNLHSNTLHDIISYICYMIKIMMSQVVIFFHPLLLL